MSYAVSVIPPPARGAVLPTDSEQLYLAVSINGNQISQVLPFTRQDNGLWASPTVLRSIGFKNIDDAKSLIRLDSLHGTQADYDMVNQAAVIKAPLSELALASTVVDADIQKAPTLSGGQGLLFNYELYGTRDNQGSSLLSATSELRAFSSWGLFTNTMLNQVGKTANTGFEAGPKGWAAHNVRLDTAWVTSWRDKALTLTVGDTNTGGLAWSRSTRIGGIRFGRNFALQPYRNTAPLPAFLGSAVMPSAIDLYIDGIRQYNGRVPAGPFQINSLPTVSGRGTAQVVLTDATGRRTEVSIPFYSGSTLLDQGLSDWSLEAGYVRNDFGLKSFGYGGDPMFSGTLRYGLSKALTLETHAETSRSTRVTGAGAVGTLGSFGQLNGSYSVSQGDGRRGAQYSLGYQWQSRYFNFGANSSRTRGEYRDVASLYGAPPPKVSESVVIGTNLDQVGTINLNYVRVHYLGQEPSRYAGVYWGRSIGSRVSVSASYNRNLNDSRDQSLFFGVNISLDGRLSAYSSIQRNGQETSYTAGANQSTQENTGWGWGLGAQRNAGGDSTATGEVDYRGRYGEYRAGHNSYGRARTTYAGASGALVMMGDGVFASRQIYDGFALVSTDGVPNVPVKLHNNPVGRSDADGMLIISPLSAYQKNLVSIDPMDLPINVKIDRTAINVATSDRAGALVKFGIAPVRAASLTLQDSGGKPLPLGASVLLNTEADPYFVGYDGMIYLEGLKNQNTITATWPDHSCAVTFVYHDPGNALAQIGPLRCD